MSTDTKTKTCTSRGERTEDGIPVCGLPRGHHGEHMPHPDDGWDGTVRWPNGREKNQPEQWTVVYTAPYGAPRAEGPMSEADAMRRRNELFDLADQGWRFSVELVRHVPAPAAVGR